MKTLINVMGKDVISPVAWSFERENRLYAYLAQSLEQGGITHGAFNDDGEELFPCNIKYIISGRILADEEKELSINEMTILLMNDWMITNYFDLEDPQITFSTITRRVCEVNEI